MARPSPSGTRSHRASSGRRRRRSAPTWSGSWSAMTRHAEYDQLVESSPQGTLFCTSWWLDAVAPGRWQPNELAEDGAVVAAWPTVVRKGRFGVEHGGAPLTPWLGPLFGPDLRRSLEDEITGRLLERIGSYAQLTARCSPAYDYWTPLYWRGFTQTTRYTWRI